MNFIQEHLAGYGMSEQMVVYLSNIIMVLCIALLSIVANLVAKKIVLKIIIHIIHNNRYTWDNIFLEKKYFTSCRISLRPLSFITPRLFFRCISLSL